MASVLIMLKARPTQTLALTSNLHYCTVDPITNEGKWMQQPGCVIKQHAQLAERPCHCIYSSNTMLSFLLLLHSLAIFLGFTVIGEIFTYVTLVESGHWGSHILSSWSLHSGCVFVASIYPSRTWMSGSFEPKRWNACVHRQDLGLYSHLKEFWGNGVRAHVNSKRKSPTPEQFSSDSEEDRTCNAASQRTVSPTHYQQAIPFPAPRLPIQTSTNEYMKRNGRDRYRQKQTQ